MMSNYSDKADGACKPGWVVSQFQLSVYHNGSIKDMNSRSTLTLWEFFPPAYCPQFVTTQLTSHLSLWILLSGVLAKA